MTTEHDYNKLHAPQGETWTDDYQLKHYKTSLKHCKTRRTAIDCGAHIGIFTRRYAQDFQKVIAIEPITPTHLATNTQHLGNVQVIPQAVYKDSHTKMYAHNPGTLTAHTELQLESIANAQAIPTVAIDDLDLTDVDIIKIDTQGLEWEVVVGATNTIKTCKPILHIETRDTLLLDRICEQFNYKRLDVHIKDWVLGSAE